MTITFDTLGLNPTLLAALTEAGYTTPTDVQARAIPAALSGTDVRVCSHTGSGKTAAYLLPALERVWAAYQERQAARQAAAAAHAAAAPTAAATEIVVPPVNTVPGAFGHQMAADGEGRSRRPGPYKRDPRKNVAREPARSPKVLVLAPTRELAMQVAKATDTYGRKVPDMRVTVAVGGMPYPPQLMALRGPLDILIATPGRLIDHLERGAVRLDEIELLVLDEADRMLDMGFIEDIERIAQSLPAERQTIMVSATFAGNVGRLAREILKPDAQQIDVGAQTESHDSIAQELMWADDLDHKDALLDHLLTDKDLQQAVVFTSTQRDADVLAERLYNMGHAVAPLHGGMPQGRRNRTLMALRRGELRVLIATDVAARGIDVPTISHVINYGLPMKAEDYVHRIGRTGRAGRSGRAITLAERRDVSMIRRIQQFTTQAIPVGMIEGLEPRRPAPFMDSRRPMDSRSGPRPSGHRGAPRPGGFDSRGPARFEPRHAGPGGDRFDPRGRADARPVDRGFPAARPSGPRSGAFDPRFEQPRFEHRAERGFDDRAPRFAPDRGLAGAPVARTRPAGPGPRPEFRGGPARRPR